MALELIPFKNGNPIRLFQVSDSHCYANDDTRLSWTDEPVYPNLSLQAVLNHIMDKAADHAALVLTGDLAQEETAETYRRIGQMLSKFPLPAYVLPGNHDAPGLMNANLGLSAQLQKYVDLGVWHLLFLDSHVPGQAYGSLSETELDQIKYQLSRIPRDHFATLFIHHHPIDIGSEWLDAMGLRQRVSFWNLIESFPQVQAVFHGHVHQEFSGVHEYGDGRRVMVYGTPATCIQVKPGTKALEFDHVFPAWRDIILHPDGKMETQVNYLSRERT